MNDVIQHFEISNQHIQEVSPGKGNWLVLKDTTKEEQEEIIKNYRLPQNIFVGGNHAEEVSRLEPLENTALNNSYALGVTNLSAEKKEQIEERLEPLILLIVYLKNIMRKFIHLPNSFRMAFICFILTILKNC